VCSDTDITELYPNGINVYLTETVTDVYGMRGTNACEFTLGGDSIYVKEFYCSPAGELQTKIIECPNKQNCTKGRCNIGPVRSAGFFNYLKILFS